jgi:hypothetical protein
MVPRSGWSSTSVIWSRESRYDLFEMEALFLKLLSLAYSGTLKIERV